MTRPLRRAAWVALVIVLLSLVWAAWRLNSARQHLVAARGELASARESLLQRDVTTARPALDAASRQTRAARSVAQDPVVWAWAHVPLLGNNAEVVRRVAIDADEIARGVLPDALAAAEELNPRRLRDASGAFNVDAIRRAEPGVARASVRMARIATDTRRFPRHLLVPQVASARDEFALEASKLDTALQNAADGVRVAPTFLGAGKPRRWFVAVQQFGESRGTGGIIGGFAVLETSNGRLRVSQHGSNADLRSVTVSGKSVSAEFRGRYELQGSLEIWPNLNLSPDFPSVASLIREKWAAQGGGSLDGVIGLDARSLQLLLKGGPPLDIAGQSVPPSELEAFLSVGQYRGIAPGPRGLLQRKDALSDAASTVLGSLAEGRGDSEALLRGVVDAVSSGHVRFEATDASVHRVLARTGLNGALPSGPAPVAYAVVNNASGGKLDYWLDRSISYRAGACEGRRRESTISVSLLNRAPALTQIPPYVSNREADGTITQSRTGRVLLEVYGTPGSVLVAAELDGRAVSTVQGRTVTELEASEEGGLPVWQLLVDTPPDRATVFTLHLSEPVVGGSARLPEQPLARPLTRDVQVPVC